MGDKDQFFDFCPQSLEAFATFGKPLSEFMYRFYRAMYALVGFSRSQSNGFLVFLPLLLLFIMSEPLYRHWRARKIHYSSFEILALDSLMEMMGSPEMENEVAHGETRFTAIPFDPNTASVEVMERCGIGKKVANRVLGYRKKGGVFRIKDDLLKIYGFDSTLHSAIRKFIQLPDRRDATRTSIQGKFEPRKIETRKFDLNTADTAALRGVYGIGEKLSLRIIKYRDGLGGFVSMDQLREIYRLDTGVITSLNTRFYIAKDFRPRTIKLNFAGRQDLAAHPYISPKAAEAIVAYRFQHGEFASIEDLRRIPLIDTAMLRKIIPYVIIHDSRE